jgi:hypothetical protein
VLLPRKALLFSGEGNFSIDDQSDGTVVSDKSQAILAVIEFAVRDSGETKNNHVVQNSRSSIRWSGMDRHSAVSDAGFFDVLHGIFFVTMRAGEPMNKRRAALLTACSLSNAAALAAR